MVHLVPKPESFGLKFLNYNTESCILKQNIYKKKNLNLLSEKGKEILAHRNSYLEKSLYGG